MAINRPLFPTSLRLIRPPALQLLADEEPQQVQLVTLRHRKDMPLVLESNHYLLSTHGTTNEKL